MVVTTDPLNVYDFVSEKKEDSRLEGKGERSEGGIWKIERTPGKETGHAPDWYLPLILSLNCPRATKNIERTVCSTMKLELFAGTFILVD